MVKIRFYDPDDKPKAPAAHKPAFTTAPKKGLTLDWPRELQWRESPFTTLMLLPAHQYIVGQDAARQAINLFFIKEQWFGTISGEPGSGKTFLLQWLSEELQPYKDRYSVHRFDASLTPEQFSQELSEPYSTLLTKYRGTDPAALAEFLQRRAKRKLVLLIDNGNALGPLEPYLLALRDKLGAVIIIAGTKPHAIAPDALKVTLTHLSTEEASKLVEKRIARVGGSGIAPFSPLLLNELWLASRSNPVTFLQFCNETAMKIALKQISVQEREEQLQKQLIPDLKGSKKVSKPTKDAPVDKKKSLSPYDDLINDLLG
jgi:hypothetical protein